VAQADPLTGDGVVADAPPSKSPWVLRVELDREKMFSKNINMDDIALILRTKFGADITTLYTDYNSSRLVFRIRVNPEITPTGGRVIDDLASLKTLQNKILSGTAVRGIPGLRTVNYQKITDAVELKDGKYVPVEEYVLISDGSNFLDVLTHPDVDASRVVSSNVHDMFENLGIEATRATFYKEITTLFAESGSSVNYRHVCILLDKICSKGRTMSIDRYGINKNDIGPLAKMSFEQTEDIALRAAIFGERDPVLGISAKVMLGAPIKAGTSFSEILFDELDAIQLSESTPEQRTPVASGPQRFTGDEIGDTLYDTEVEGDCSAANLRIGVSLPVAPTLETVEEMEDVDIAVYE
jgi:DNA-directed RNA polymerase beta' subunit